MDRHHSSCVLDVEPVLQPTASMIEHYTKCCRETQSMFNQATIKKFTDALLVDKNHEQLVTHKMYLQ